jgi:hypothetical protein
MSAFRWSSAAALLVVIASPASQLFAQPSEAVIKQSHNPEVLTLPKGDLDAGWLEQLKKQRLDLRIHQDTGLRPEDLDRLKKDPDKLIELLKKSGLKPDMIEMIEKNRALLDMGIEGAKERLKQEKESGESGAAPEQNPAQQQPEPPLKDPQRNQQEALAPEQKAPATDVQFQKQDPVGGTDPAGQAGAPGRLTPDDSGDAQTPRLPVGDKLQSWAEKLLANSQLSGSPAMQKAFQSLAKSSIGTEDPKWRKLAEAGGQFRDQLSGWGKSVKLDRLWPAGGFNLPDIITPEKVPQMSSPTWLSRVAGDSSLPRFGTPDASAGNILTVLAWIVGIAAAAMCLRQFWLRTEESRQERRRVQALRRAWPVDPASVKSREDLIRAFEHLALTNLGVNAKTWNHLAIAAGLGKSADPLRRNAALSLTDTYEQARYAPAEEPLPGELIVEARHHLSVLAGVKGA